MGKSIIVIGAGIAGLSAGCYARMNGYETRIFELHDKPGGLCTAWKREGYTFDGCIHWLVGSRPGSGMNRVRQAPGGGVPTAAGSAKRCIQRLCKRDGKRFTVTR